jgi:phosphatidylglycerol:prolipoprotein diacylglycerol transferase
MTLPLAYWVDNLSPFVIHFWGNVGIRWYGLAYVCGFLAGGWLLIRYYRAGRSDLPADRVPDFILALVMGVLLGGRIGYFLLYDFDLFIHHPLVLFQVWDGGMASHGGFVGVCIAVWWFSRRSHLSFFHLADLQCSAVPVGLLLGRLANFINGELWGKISVVPWAVIFPKSAPDTPLAMIPPRHPSQLYEAALEGVLLLAFMQWRVWKTSVLRLQPGRLTGEFMVVYALVRIFCEVYREPDVGVSLIFGLSRGTFYSLFLVLFGCALIIYAARRRTPDVAAGK